jgi:hypothetical protein
MTVNLQPEYPNVAPFRVETHCKEWSRDSGKYEVFPHSWIYAEGLSMEFVVAMVWADAQNSQKNLRCRIFDSEGKVILQFMAKWDHGRTSVGYNNDGTMYRLYCGLTSSEAKFYNIKVNLGSCDRFAR